MSSSDRTARGREIEDSTAARLAEIVASAEKAAKQVIDEAEAEARSRLIDAREEADRIVAERLAGLAGLTDEIAAQAEALRRQSEALQRALVEAKAELGGSGPDAQFDKPAGPALSIVGTLAELKVEPRVDGEVGGDPGFNGAPDDGSTPAGARLLATQMAVSGSSRVEIEERLRNGFAIEDTSAILDAILGPEK